MANETTYALIQSWLPDIVEATEMLLMKDTVMPGLVTVFSDRTGREPRRADKYSAGTVGTVAETADLSTLQEFSRTPFGTVTPGEIGSAYLITDARMESDNVPNIMSDFLEVNRYVFASKVDTDLLGAFSSFTGGSVGSAGSALTWETIAKAEAIAVASGIPGPYSVVIHPYAALQLGIGRANAVPLVIEPALRAANQFYLGSFGALGIYRAPLLTAGTAVVQGLFNRRAIAFDMRRAFRVEPERDASKRATELIPTMVYASGVWRADMGVKIVSDASVPS